jgi:23S rRNA (uracil1939-C5)-methyltransferase
VRKSKPAPLLEKVLIEDYAAEGKALARVNGKVIFVEGAVPGDVVDIQLQKNKADWGEGFVKHFHSYSEIRVTPFCSHFGVCGGCQWQMLPYEQQLVYKHKQVVDNLTRIAKVPLPNIPPIMGALETQGYRNKVEYTFATEKFIPFGEFKAMKVAAEENPAAILPAKAPGVAGFHARGFFEKVVEVDKCYLQKEPTNDLRKAVVDFVIANEMPFYNIKEHRGWVRNMFIRNTTKGEWMVNLILGYEDKEKREALFTILLQRFPQITTLLYTINAKRNDSMQDLLPQIYSGSGYITEYLEDFQFKISPKSFFQTNSKQAEKLYQVTRDFAELTGKEIVYDLYCGTGSIGIFCSKNAKKIIGVEVVEEAIEDAKENARMNQLTETAFFAGDVIKICDTEFFKAHGKPDVIITDPPRAGMHEKLVHKLLEMEAPIIVYVSCNPATQARDLSLLKEKYTVTKIQPVDMFPHTLHIENVVQLKRKDLL